MFKLVRRTEWWYALGWHLMRGVLTVYNRLKVVGVENIPLEGGLLFACNHISHLDPPSVGVSVPRRLRFVAKEELFHQFFLGWYLPTVGVIPIKRGAGGNLMLDKAADAIEKGDAVIMFPEGTRSRTGLPGRAHTGIIVLAARTGAPIVPVRISGSYDCMPPGSPFPRPGRIQVSFGPPVKWAQGELDLNDRGLMQREAQRLMETIMSLPGWLPKKVVAARDQQKEIDKSNSTSDAQ